MRKTLIVVTAFGLLLAACAKSSEPAASPSASGSESPTGPPATAADCAKGVTSYVNAGTLTVATDSPAYPPWFIHNDPSNGKGYESAVAYEVAKRLGFSASQVTWVVEPFNKSYAPGPKDFDFDINEISVTPERETVVTFSESYYDVTQALIAMAGTPITKAKTIADLKGYKLGSQIGTTSLTYIAQYIKPTQQAAVYDTTNDAKAALQAGQLDGLVLDLPTAAYVSGFQIKGSVLVGQFPSTGEHYGLLFQKDNPLAACVNQAIAEITSDGTLQALQQKYLSDYLSVPVIQP